MDIIYRWIQVYKFILFQQMADTQEALGDEFFEGTAGGGMVKVVVNGKQDLLSINIDPEVVDPEDIEMLQDLIVAAVNQARQKAQDLQNEQMSGLTGGMNIPGMNLPF